MWINPVDMRMKSPLSLKNQRFRDLSFPHALVENIVYKVRFSCGKNLQARLFGPFGFVEKNYRKKH
jgi:hypothetical protein